MSDQERGPFAWEKALLGVISNEVAQLRYLLANKDGDTELPDVHAQISRLGGLTDLVFAESFGLSKASRAAIESMAYEAEGLVRDNIDFPERPQAGS